MDINTKQDLISLLNNTENPELFNLIELALEHNDGILAASILAEQ